MPKLLYSHKLKCVVPMLSDVEYAPVADLLAASVKVAKERWETSDCTREEAWAGRPSDAMDIYEGLTGQRLSDLDDLRWVCLTNYGSPCPACGKPFRSPMAKHCAACGYELPSGEVAGPAT